MPAGDIHEIEPLSVASAYIEPRFGPLSLGSASGFFVRWGSKLALVTNWHVVTGRDANTAEVSSGMGAVPDGLCVHSFTGLTSTGEPSWAERHVPLYEDEGFQKPWWREHQELGSLADIAVIQFDDVLVDRDSTHDLEAANPGLALRPTSAVSTIGFPFGRQVGMLGIWVQGTVASEPSIDYRGRPSFLIDSRTRPGMSGAPVVQYHGGGVANMAGGFSRVIARPIHHLLGIYSGRVHPDADLGIVWKTSLIRDIMREGVRGEDPRARWQRANRDP